MGKVKTALLAQTEDDMGISEADFQRFYDPQTDTGCYDMTADDLEQDWNNATLPKDNKDEPEWE